MGYHSDFFTRLTESLYTGSAFARLPQWIEQKTTLKGEPWSFRHHEYQIAIAEETCAELVCQKCSQVGMSELSVRIMLALLAIKQGFTGIYTLPTRNFAQKFAKARFDPVIEGSEVLSRLIIRGSDGAEMKRLGMSTLYIGGASTDSQAISIPADVLVRDEYDFSNPIILGKLESRLRHAENGGFKRDFSTPTIPGYGIAALLDGSSKARYMVRCERCNTVQAPEMDTHLVIPGFDQEFKLFDAEQLTVNPDGVRNAYLKCEKCGLDLWESLCDASRRSWEHKYLERDVKGYEVRPFDVPKYNAIPSILNQIKKYETRQDYDNFVLGIPHKSRHSQIDVSICKQKVKHMENVEGGNGYYIGIDVGKIVYVTIIKKEGRYTKVERFMQLYAAKGALFEQCRDVINNYGAEKVVIDSAPDFTLCKALLSEFGEMIHPAVYIKDTVRKPQMLEIKEEDNMVLIQRTKAFDAMVGDINEGRYEFPSGRETEIAFIHFEGMKRVTMETEEGDRMARWVKLPNTSDHYMHSLLYANTAAALGEDDSFAGTSYAVPWAVAGASMATAAMERHKESLVDMIRRAVR